MLLVFFILPLLKSLSPKSNLNYPLFHRSHTSDDEVYNEEQIFAPETLLHVTEFSSLSSIISDGGLGTKYANHGGMDGIKWYSSNGRFFYNSGSIVLEKNMEVAFCIDKNYCETKNMQQEIFTGNAFAPLFGAFKALLLHNKKDYDMVLDLVERDQMVLPLGIHILHANWNPSHIEIHTSTQIKKGIDVSIIHNLMKTTTLPDSIKQDPYLSTIINKETENSIQNSFSMFHKHFYNDLPLEIHPTIKLLLLAKTFENPSVENLESSILTQSLFQQWVPPTLTRLSFDLIHSHLFEDYLDQKITLDHLLNQCSSLENKYKISSRVILKLLLILNFSFHSHFNLSQIHQTQLKLLEDKLKLVDSNQLYYSTHSLFLLEQDFPSLSNLVLRPPFLFQKFEQQGPLNALVIHQNDIAPHHPYHELLRRTVSITQTGAVNFPHAKSSHFIETVIQGDFRITLMEPQTAFMVFLNTYFLPKTKNNLIQLKDAKYDSYIYIESFSELHDTQEDIFSIHSDNTFYGVVPPENVNINNQEDLDLFLKETHKHFGDVDTFPIFDILWKMKKYDLVLSKYSLKEIVKNWHKFRYSDEQIASLINQLDDTQIKSSLIDIFINSSRFNVIKILIQINSDTNFFTNIKVISSYFNYLKTQFQQKASIEDIHLFLRMIQSSNISKKSIYVLFLENFPSIEWVPTFENIFSISIQDAFTTSALDFNESKNQLQLFVALVNKDVVNFSDQQCSSNLLELCRQNKFEEVTHICLVNPSIVAKHMIQEETYLLYEIALKIKEILDNSNTPQPPLIYYSAIKCLHTLLNQEIKIPNSQWFHLILPHLLHHQNFAILDTVFQKNIHFSELSTSITYNHLTKEWIAYLEHIQTLKTHDETPIQYLLKNAILFIFQSNEMNLQLISKLILNFPFSLISDLREFLSQSSLEPTHIENFEQFPLGDQIKLFFIIQQIDLFFLTPKQVNNFAFQLLKNADAQSISDIFGKYHQVFDWTIQKNKSTLIQNLILYQKEQNINLDSLLKLIFELGYGTKKDKNLLQNKIKSTVHYREKKISHNRQYTNQGLKQSSEKNLVQQTTPKLFYRPRHSHVKDKLLSNA